MILIHRPFVQYNDTVPDGLDLQFKSLCRATCASSAEAIADILESYRERFELSQVYGTAVQHAGTAATAMMGEVVMLGDSTRRSHLVAKLSSLRMSVDLMSRNYRGAGLMVSVMDRFIRSIDKFQVRGGKGTAPSQHGYDESAVGEAGKREDELNRFVMAQGPAMMANSVPQRWRLDSWSAFAPTPTGYESSAGLPFLPSGFLEGMSEDGFCYWDTAMGPYEPSTWVNGATQGYQ